jgi:hypothetical protein
MAEMSMNKAIHGAFRRDLGRFLDALDVYDDGDHKRADQLGTAWANLDDQLRRHHQGEHDISWLALEAVGVNPAVLAQMDIEHDRLAAALDAAGVAMTAFQGTASAPEAKTAQAAIQELQVVAVEHLDHEEAEIEQVYLSERDNPEIKAMGRKFGQASPAVSGRFLAWVTDGATPDELAAIKRNVPPPVLTVFSRVFGRSYRRDVAPAWRA